MLVAQLRVGGRKALTGPLELAYAASEPAPQPRQAPAAKEGQHDEGKAQQDNQVDHATSSFSDNVTRSNRVGPGGGWATRGSRAAPATAECIVGSPSSSRAFCGEVTRSCWRCVDLERAGYVGCTAPTAALSPLSVAAPRRVPRNRTIRLGDYPPMMVLAVRYPTSEQPLPQRT
jgi:hypothetical protein